MPNSDWVYLGLAFGPTIVGAAVYLLLRMRKRNLLVQDERLLMQRIGNLQRQQMALEKWVANYARERRPIP